jgi:hypothetical protein
MNITDAKEEYVVNPPLVLPEKMYLPPLHIMLGLMKNFVKGMDKTGRGFQYRGADKSLARPTSRCILFDGENISFDASLLIYT